MLPVIADHYPIEIALECKFINFVKTLAKSNNNSVAYMANYDAHRSGPWIDWAVTF